MSSFEIVAHRGVPDEFPENTLPSFQRAIELDADAVELDVRLTKDKVPVVYHYFYLQEATALTGPIFDYTQEQLHSAKIIGVESEDFFIPTLDDVLDSIGGRIGLEIEIKGPEPESSQIIASVLNSRKPLWDSIEITSYEPALLVDIKRRCPGIVTDLLIPRSEGWMGLDVVTYMAIQRAKLAGARAVHLHPTQLTEEVVRDIRGQGIEVHAWDVNDEDSLQLMYALSVPKICTDSLRLAVDYRKRIGT